MTTVEVVWDDAWVSTDTITVKKARKLKPERTRTIGLLVCENDYGLVLATDGWETCRKSYNTHMMIPHGMIVEVWEWEDV